MNYRNIALSELEQMAGEYPKMTVGQIILSVASEKQNKEKSTNEWLFEVSDEDFYTAIEKAKSAEKPETEFFNTEDNG